MADLTQSSGQINVKLQSYLPKNLKAFYDGKWQSSGDCTYNETFCPSNGKVIAQVAFAGKIDTFGAIQAADRAFISWKATSPKERAAFLRQIATILRAHAEELSLVDAYNSGNPCKEMLRDVYSGADQIEFFAGLIPAVLGETRDLGSDEFHFTMREPLGVIGRIVASNHPLMFTAAKIAAPLAMGNTVVIKLPEQTPLSGLRLMELIEGVLPPGVLNILPGGAECGKILASHPLVTKVTLIGSLPTGRAIQKSAADTLKTSILELGGKNALLAYTDADLDTLVDGVVRGMNFGWCGQSCGSTSRVFLHESHYDEVLGRVKQKVEASYKPGDPTNPKTTMGSLVSKAAQDRVLRYITLGKEEGARIVTGGKVPESPETQGGFFIEPTIFADVTQEMKVASEEIFGPVISVLKWSDEAKMLEQVNSVEYGLTAAIFTRDLKTMYKAVRQVQAGYIWVNTVGTHYLGMPFGGYKQSGIGREECLDEMISMTQLKCVNVKF